MNKSKVVLINIMDVSGSVGQTKRIWLNCIWIHTRDF